jgi:putative ABC transport system ATP-binding protein
VTATTPALELAGVERAHAAGNARFVLEIDRFAVRRGEAIALTGPSGTGKSTMLDLLALALKPDRADRFALTTRAGAVVDVAAAWARDDIDALTAVRAAHHGYVLQQGGLLPYLTVRENIALSQRVQGVDDPAQVEAVALNLEIAGLLDRKPAALSVGQRQRAAIARAIAHRPEIVLADEPTASVHPALADTVMALLVAQAREADAALILATHDPARAARHGIEIVEVEIAVGSGGGRSRFSRRASTGA